MPDWNSKTPPSSSKKSKERLYKETYTMNVMCFLENIFMKNNRFFPLSFLNSKKYSFYCKYKVLVIINLENS